MTHSLDPENVLIDEEVCIRMQGIASKLNLKSHTVQVNDDRRVRLCLSATVEVHYDRCADMYYLSNLCDIFPVDHHCRPAAPNVADSPTFKPKNADMSRRLRPEFIEVYLTALCADGLTPMCGGSRREKETNDEECLKAARFLRENWIPAFVWSLDNMEVCFYDSASLTSAMHRKGINMRYLGLISQKSTIPFVRSMTLVEMVARVFKGVFRERLRGAILHFRSVGATSIDEQMSFYTTNLTSIALGHGDKTRNFFESKIKEEIKRKFDFDITYRQYYEIGRPALFLAIQYHVLWDALTNSGWI